MLSFLRFKKNGLPYDLLAAHERATKDIFSYFEKGRRVRKRVRKARKAIKGALRFAKKKQAFPSKKTAEALDALEQIRDEIEYTQQALRTAYQEAQTIVELIGQEKVGELFPMVEKAKEQFNSRDLEGGMTVLREINVRLKNGYLPKSRKATLAGLDSDVKKLKSELMAHRNKSS